MEQRDVLKDEIEQLGRVIGKLISDFLALDQTGDLQQSITQSQRQLKEKGLDVDKLIACADTELAAF